MALKGGKISFLQGQAPNRFPNPKWSVLNKCIYGQQVDSGGCVYVCIHIQIVIEQEVMNSRRQKREKKELEAGQTEVEIM